MEDYMGTAKLFYKWLLSNDEEYPPYVSWIKRGKSLSQRPKPESLISRGDMKA